VVTGARGFVGRFVVAALHERGVEVVALERSPSAGATSGADLELVARASDAESALVRLVSGSVAVIHLAALVHDLRGRTSAADYTLINRDYTLRLARAARSAGVRRFVFQSSIKINGDESGDTPISESTPALPIGAYASSKWQAERGLAALAGDLSSVSVRSPLVYGPGVRANFERLLRAVLQRTPLPLGAITNRRSLIYVENLAHALAEIALAPGWCSSTYVVSDGEDLSTPELVRRLGKALGVAPRLIAVPEPVLGAALTALGQRALVPRLLGSLTVDASRLRRELGWSPPVSVDEALARTGRWYRGAR
jgi:nucleoside-diphosphate-sugar epimerase